MLKRLNKSTARKQLLAYWQHLPSSVQQEALDFMGYLLVRSETEEDATAELLKDKVAMSGIKKGLSQMKRGEVRDVVF